MMTQQYLKQETSTPISKTAFRIAEKEYKSRAHKPDYGKVVDISKGGSDVIPIELKHDLVNDRGIFVHNRPNAYTLNGHPGLIVIPNPFTQQAQRWLTRKCLCDCSKPPNKTNLDAFFHLPETSLFENSARGSSDGSSELIIPRDIDLESDNVTAPRDGSFLSKPQTAAHLLPHLRWCTLGHQYNWKTKKYDLGITGFDNHIHSVMKAICVAISDTSYNLGDSEGDVKINSYNGLEFVSQAGIINYYGVRDTMAAHVDRTEEAMDAPLISLSLGCTCIYLIGGITRDEKPTAIYLRSGDVLAMCGESRLSYHSVPRVLENTAPKYLTDLHAGDTDLDADEYPAWCNFAQYLNNHRINCNARKCF